MPEQLNALLRLGKIQPTGKEAVIPERQLSGQGHRPFRPTTSPPCSKDEGLLYALHLSLKASNCLLLIRPEASTHSIFVVESACSSLDRNGFHQSTSKKYLLLHAPPISQIAPHQTS